MNVSKPSRRDFLSFSAAAMIAPSLENLVHAQPIPNVDLSLMLAALNALNTKGQDKREKAPTNGALKDAEKQVQGVFENDYKARKPEFAETLLKGAGEQKGATRFVMLRDAADISSDNFKLPTTFKAIEQLAENYDAKLEPIVSGALKAAKSKAKKPEQNAEFTQFGINVAELSLKWRDYDAASKAITDAKSTAGKSGDKSLVERANELDKEVTVIKKEYDDYKKAEVELGKIQPADTVGNPKLQADFEKYSLIVGKWNCFQENKWDIGMYMLRVGADKDLQEIAKKEIALKEEKVKPTAQNFYDLAESWYTKFQSERNPRDKTRYLTRAWNWYENSLDAATKSKDPLERLFKSKVEARMGEIEKLGAVKGNLVDLLKMVEPKKDSITGDWQFAGAALVSPLVEQARLQIPYLPPEEYDLRVVAARKENSDALIIGLVKGEKQFDVVIDGWGGNISGIDTIDGKAGKENETAYKGKIFSDGSSSKTILCSVRKNKVTVTVDGKAIINWNADYSRVAPYVKLKDSKTVYLGCNKTSYNIGLVQLVNVSGEGKKLR